MKWESGTKMQIMVLGCVNATGDFMSLYLVYPSHLMTVCMGYENFPEVIYTQTDNSWMGADSFFEFICYFNALVKKLKIVRPVILWVDRHMSLLEAQMARFCHVNGNILFILLGNAMFIIQPFDVRIFSELKQAWVSTVHTFTKDDLSHLLTKGTFSWVLKMAWDEITRNSEKAIRISGNTFRRSGIFLFDPVAVNYSQLITNLNAQEWVEEQEIQKLVRGAIKHEPNPNAYTLSGSGKVNKDETIFEPAKVAAVPIEQAMEPVDEAKTNENQNEARNNENRMNAEVIKNLTEAWNNERINDPDWVTEVNPKMGDEVLCVQPKVSLKTEDGTVIGTVPAIMIPVKQGPSISWRLQKSLKRKKPRSLGH